MALLDEALDEGPARAVRAHVADCPSCRSRTARLRERDDAVRSWLRRHDPSAPPAEAYDLPPVRSAPGTDRPGRRRAASGRRYRRWAAAAVLVLVAGVLAGPARGWVADRVGSILDPDPAANGAVEAGTDVSPATSFLPSGRELEVVFEGRPAAGTLVVDRGGEPLVTVRVPEGVELRVQSGRVMVAGPAPVAAEYRLTVPSGLDRVVVRVPGYDALEIDLRGDTPMPRRIPLELPPTPPAGS